VLYICGAAGIGGAGIPAEDINAQVVRRGHGEEGRGQIRDDAKFVGKVKNMPFRPNSRQEIRINRSTSPLYLKPGNSPRIFRINQ
jgi:hypothetical protein